jgi:hypothetical protein
MLKGDASNYFWSLELLGLEGHTCCIKMWSEWVDTLGCIKICEVDELALVGMCLPTWHMKSTPFLDPFSICKHSLGLGFYFTCNSLLLLYSI